MFSDLALTTFTAILTGLKLTLAITLCSFVVGQMIALPLALASLSKRRILRWPSRSWIFLIRGSPLMVQLFLIYYGLGTISAVRHSVFWPLLREPMGCVILAIGLNSAAYMGAMLAGALERMPRGLVEAARSLGLSPSQSLLRITLPILYRQVIPVLGNEMTLVMKASALASTITVLEMTGIARKIVAQTFAPFEVFAIAGLVYLVAGLIIAWGFRGLEAALRIPGLGAGKP